jgi:ABC-type nitrate/sulfonate/bicarbonate transport system ATPase subunit
VSGGTVLTVAGAHKSYPQGDTGVPVFRDVELAVRSGEVFSLLGSTGCGKSTLLRVMAGLEELTSGSIDSERDLKTGMVFQEPRLFPWLNVRDNVGLGLRYRSNREAAEREETVDEILRDFGISRIAAAFPEDISGGQAQRVSLARTLVTAPDTLLLDEPFSALDPRTRADLQDWLLEVVRRRKLTVVFVTHDLEEAIYLGDRVGLMSGSPATLANIWDTSGHRNRSFASDEAQGLKQEITGLYREAA